MGASKEIQVAVITAVFGSYDNIPPVPNGFDEAILVSDHPIDSPWTNIVLSNDLPARFASKIPKFRPDLFTRSGYSVWVDASMRDPQDWLFNDAIEQLAKCDLVLFKHPQRQTIAEEVVASRELKKYDRFRLEDQVQFYFDSGFADDVGLWAGGVIARKHTKANVEFGNEWLVQNSIWSIQDQLSLPYVVWKLGMEVGTFSEDQYIGPLRWIQHKGELNAFATLISNLLGRKPSRLETYFSTAIQLVIRRQYRELFLGLRKVFRDKN